MTSKNYIYVKKGKIGTNAQTISFLYLLMVWDGMELKIDDIVHFVSGFSNLTDLISWKINCACITIFHEMYKRPVTVTN